MAMDRIEQAWRAMRADDLSAVATISDTVHGPYRESAATYAERLALYPAGCLVLERAGAVAGFLVSHPWHRDRPPALDERLGAIPPQSDCYYLHDIALLPATRGSGAGKAAVAYVVDHARTRGFADIALVAVNGAERFWAAQGFVIADDGTASPYGSGTYKMRRTLENP